MSLLPRNFLDNPWKKKSSKSLQTKKGILSYILHFPSTVTQLLYLYYAFAVNCDATMVNTTGCLAHCRCSVLL